MTRKQKQVGAFLALAAIVAFLSWPLYQYFRVQAASAAVQQRVQLLVEQNPQFQSAWKEAMQDDVLSEEEATAIIEQAGEQPAASQ